jgi:hypothetical protein
MAAAVVALGAVVFTAATGGIGALVGSIGSSLTGFVHQIIATPQPSASAAVILDAPVIASPTEPYTNQPTVDLEISVPGDLVGDTAARVRIYLALEGQAASPIAEVPVGSTVNMIVPVDLTAGRNDLSATIVEGSVESDSSPIVTFILDTEPPKIVVTSPADGATVNRPTATVTGTTQPRTTLLARDTTSGTSVAAEAGSDGTFSFTLPLDPGPNSVKITGTDPAGNVGDLTLSIVRGNGTLTSILSVSAYRISTGSLPVSIQLGVLVTDPDGKPLAAAMVTFTLTAPGIPPIAKDAVTDADGRATFTTTLPKGVTTGVGLATVLVATDRFGSTSAQKPITIVK